MPKQDAVTFPNPDAGWGDGMSLLQTFLRRCSNLLYHTAPATDPNSYSHIPLQVESNPQREKPELTDDELLITSPVLMGFSLADKLWCE